MRKFSEDKVLNIVNIEVSKYLKLHCSTYAFDDDDTQTGAVECWLLYLLFSNVVDRRTSVDSPDGNFTLYSCSLTALTIFAWLSGISTS